MTAATLIGTAPVSDEAGGLSAREAALLEENERLRRLLAVAGREAGTALAEPAGLQDASQQAAAEAALAASEGRLRLILDSATDYAIITMDLEGRLTGWNTGAENILGWSEAGALGQDGRMIWTPEDRASGVPDAEMSAARDKGRAADERWHLRRDGSRFWATGELMPLRGSGGTLAGYLKILRDRTAQRQSEEALDAINARYRIAQRATNDAIRDWDLRSNGVSWNEALEAAYGWTPAQVEPTGDWWIATIHPEDRARIDRNIHAVIGGAGTGWTDEYRFRRADGSYAAVLDRGFVMRDSDGHAIRMIGAMLDLSERKRGEEALRTSEAQFRALVASSAQIVWTTDATGSVAEDSPTWRAYTGQSAEEWLGSGWLNAIHPDDRVHTGQRWREATVSLRPLEAEYRLRHAVSGGWRWTAARATPLLRDDGAVRGWIGMNTDIEDRKRAELRRDALLELADRLRDLDDPSAMAGAAAEILGRTLEVSRAGYGSVDATRETVSIERDWRDGPEIPSVAGLHALRTFGSFIEDMKRNEVVAVADVAHDPRTRSGIGQFEAIRVHALLNVPLMDGGRLAAVVFAHASAEHAWTGEEVAFARAVADRTWSALEQARSKATLRQVNDTLEQQVARRTADRNRLWRMSSDLMLIAEFDGRIVAVNPAWADVLGWAEGDLVGANLLSLIHPEDLEHTTGGAASISQGTSFSRFENRYRRADGGYACITWTAGPGDGVIVAVGRDTTTEREQAEALRRSEDQLRQSQKMEAVGQLTGGLAHDFNNLLTGIAGSLELLSTRMAQGRMKDLDRYVTAAGGAARRAAALTHRLLAFSRRQTLDPKPTDANRLISGMEDLIRRTVGPSIELVVVGAGGLWPTLVDPPQLENALLNLCINARDAMPEGGRITIETANRWLDERGARSRDLPPGQYVSVCVSDTGTGMTPEVIDKAFDPFFTTKPLGVGTGLGLSMVYGFTRQSGGQVRIYSEVDQGAMVCLYLPRHLGETDAAEPLPDLSEAPRAETGETVLVVDDEPTVRMLVTEVLADLGYTAIEAADGAAGLQVLQSDTRIDLLVSDVGLPGGMNGRQMADAARLIRPGLKVLFITGYAENAVVGDGHLEPGMHVMTKPFALEALASRIRELIAGP